MQISVTSRNLDLPEPTKDEAVRKLSRVEKVYDRFINMEITFSEDSNARGDNTVTCDVDLHAKGHYLRASGTGPDPMTACDQAEGRLTRQVRKLKTKLVEKPRLAAAEGGIG
ncbi:MAG TPA: ribosome-associated translation inhibitor RaiA [Nitriliruptoraceae bacterium]|nr:ribosome-associated translation inhibitor RaiA [Nitriliruptoraceae bacterium]